MKFFDSMKSDDKALVMILAIFFSFFSVIIICMTLVELFGK